LVRIKRAININLISVDFSTKSSLRVKVFREIKACPIIMIIASSILNLKLLELGKRNEGPIRVELVSSFDSSAYFEHTDLLKSGMTVTGKTDRVELVVKERDH